MLLDYAPQVAQARMTAAVPLDLTLELTPSRRFEVVDLRSRLSSERFGALAPYHHCLYWSSHTTAGFLDRGMSAGLSPAGVPSYVHAFRMLFPEGAGYRHDRLEHRSDLSPTQRAVEPCNGDSHLAFMAGGLRTCVTYPNDPDESVFLVELDGVGVAGPRRRMLRVIGFNEEVFVARTRLTVPVSANPIDAINLKDPQLGIYEELEAFAAVHGVSTGRLHLALSDAERHAGLTVNEFEPLLMKQDLAEVLRNPLRFAAERRALADRTLACATDNGSADRFLRMRRSVSLLVSNCDSAGPQIVDGTYQSPILVHWRKAPYRTRTLDVTLTELQ